MATATPRRQSAASLMSPPPIAGPSSLRRNDRRFSNITQSSAELRPMSPASSGRGHRRRQAIMGEGGKKGAEGDWAAMEPDDVFRRLPVHEVKRVEGKMRADALNKQSELRSMVG